MIFVPILLHPVKKFVILGVLGSEKPSSHGFEMNLLTEGVVSRHGAECQGRHAMKRECNGMLLKEFSLLFEIFCRSRLY